MRAVCLERWLECRRIVEPQLQQQQQQQQRPKHPPLYERAKIGSLLDRLHVFDCWTEPEPGKQRDDDDWETM
ncbi:hypothetical protein ZHAS_00019119 [Anopheles sinensis]|uniref:Uncharacterized protein n=1 Tax=Anopheles sinensis TaxID=74873 RepID=A0A084WLH1_ANOSI|nr:hypothetical protein ZHAS_00019119 [Anopheles sinensis]